MAGHTVALKKNTIQRSQPIRSTATSTTRFLHGILLVCASIAAWREGWLHSSFETIYAKIEEMLELGGTGVVLRAVHPDMRWLLRKSSSLLKARYRRFTTLLLRRRDLCIEEVSETFDSRHDPGLMESGLQSIHGGRRGNSR